MYKRKTRRQKLKKVSKKNQIISSSIYVNLGGKKTKSFRKKIKCII